MKSTSECLYLLQFSSQHTCLTAHCSFSRLHMLPYCFFPCADSSFTAASEKIRILIPSLFMLTLFSSRLVLETLEPLPGDRKCFRMINGVLVERTVTDVLPQLKTNADGLKKVLDDLLKQYTTKQEELEKWKVGLPSRHETIRH